jgi:hypothetical protein
VIVTTPFHGQFEAVTPAVHSVPEAEFEAFRSQYSDHFPVLVTFEGH